MKPSKFELYSRTEYYRELVRLIDGAEAGERVMLATMAFAPEEAVVRPVLAALAAAAKRGAEVNLIVDAYPFLIDQGKWLGPLWLHRSLPRRVTGRWRPAQAAIGELEAAGVKCALINQPAQRFSNPYAGRSHIKFAVVGERGFVGGCNLNSSVDIDLMVGLGKAGADWVTGLAVKIIESGNVLAAARADDMAFELAAGAKLLVDAGVPGRSLIFEQALELIDQARERVLITCQYFPNDVTADHLLAAHERGVKVEIIFNHPSQHVWPYNLLHRGVVAKARGDLPASFFEHAIGTDRPFIHAKLLATENGALIGSHNYVTAGIRLGTAEIALLNPDPDFAQAAVSKIRSQIA